MLLAAISPIL